MKTHQDVAEGDEVRVFYVNGKRMGQPEGGWPGIVDSAGPKLVGILYKDSRIPAVFRRETGRRNDKYGRQSYMTLDELAELRARETAARNALRRHHVTVEMRARLPVDVLEKLAAVLAEMESGAQDHG